MAIELPTLVQRLVLDASGFTKGTQEAEDGFKRAAASAESASGSAATAAERDYAKAARAAQEAADATNKSWANVGSKTKDVGRDLTTFVTLPLVGLAAAAIKTAGEFEATMNTMKAVAQVPQNEIKELGKLAKKMGADTVFSANEAAESMLNLAKAGISTSDIMGGALEATLDLAAAGSLDLSFAATIAGNAMNTFGLEGKDAALIADALAGAANASSADVSDLALALSQGGLAAHAAGLSIQETTAVLAAFADAGLRGSDAGTSLKTFLLNLVPDSKKARDAMADLGLSFTDLDGNMLPIRDIAEQLKEKTANLSDAQKTLALQVIFGTDAYRAALVLSEEGAAGLDKYTEATSTAGSASEVADARMQGWAGTWESFKGSLETAALSIGEVVIPAITPLVDKVKSLADAMTEMDPSSLKATAAVAGVAAAAGPTLWITGSLTKAMSSLAVTLGTTAPTILLVVAAAAALAGAFVLLWTHSETFRDIITKTWEVVSDFLVGVWEGQLRPLFTDFMRLIKALEPVLKVVFGAAMIAVITSFMAPIVTWALVAKGALEVLSLVFQVLASVAETVGRNLAPVWDGIMDSAGVVWHFLQAAWDGITDAANDLWHGMQTAWDGITDAVNSAWQALNPVWQAMQAAWDGVTDAANFLWQVFQDVWDGITDAVVAAWHFLNPIYQAIYNVFHDVLMPVIVITKAVWMDAWDVIQNVVGIAWDIISAILGAYWDFLTKTLIPAFINFKDTVMTVWGAVSDAIVYFWNTVIEPVLSAVVMFIGAVLAVAFVALKTVVLEVWDALSAAIAYAWNMIIKPIWDGIWDTVATVLVPVFDMLRSTVEFVWKAIASAVSDAWNTVSGVWGSIYDMIDGPLTAVFETFKTTVSTVWDAFTGAAATAWNSVGDIIGAALRGIGGLVSKFLGVTAGIARAVGLDHVADALQRGADAAKDWGGGGGGGEPTFQEKGYGFAAGGNLPMKVGAGFMTQGPTAVVGEGNMMYPEFVIPTDPKYRSRAAALMMKAQEKMWPAHAAGTDRLGAKGMFQGDSILSNVAEFGGDVLEGIGGAAMDALTWTVDQVRRLGRAGLEKVWPKLPAADNMGGLPASGLNTVRGGVLDMIWDKTPPAPGAESGTPGKPYDGSGRIGSGWQQITGYLDSKGQDYTVSSTTGGTHAPGSYHYSGKAVDLVGDMGAIFRTLAGGNPVPGINELFYDPMGYFFDNGARQGGSVGGHGDHLHAATFDNGGIIPPNSTGIWTNNLAVPEAVIPMASGGWLGSRAPDLGGALMYRSPGSEQAPSTPSIYIAPGALSFNPKFEGEVSDAVLERMRAELEEAFALFVDALRRGVHS